MAKKTNYMFARATQEEMAALDKLAKESGRSYAEVIRILVRWASMDETSKVWLGKVPEIGGGVEA